jgi:hypothetical protein
MAGPISRVLLMLIELSAIALGKSSLLSISCTKNACRVGISIPFNVPCTNANTPSNAMVMWAEYVA